MRKHLIAPTAIALVAAASASVSGLSTPAAFAKAADTSGHTLTVWLMTGEISSKTYDAVNAAFEQKFPGWSVNVQIQQWSGISTKLTTALAGSSPPDAMEIGNTDVSLFAASGGLADLSGVRRALPNSNKWLGGLVGPAEYNGGLYAVPLLAGDRVVIYNKQMFAKAGIKNPPHSIAQLLTDGAKLKKTFKGVKNFSPLYLPGEYWYAAIPLVWAYGGQIATHSSNGWTGQLSSSGSIAGLNAFKRIQNTLSVPASRDVNTNAPDQDSVFASGKAAMIIGGGWEPGVIVKDNPKLAGHYGTFVFPGVKLGSTAPVFIGGSDIGIAANSPYKAEAIEWVKLMTGATYQTMMVHNDGLMPNATSLLNVGKTLPGQYAYYRAAQNSNFTPASPGWATVEADATMETLFSNIATGKMSVADAAKATDTQLNNLLNAAQ